MSKKTELINIFSEYKSKYEAVQAKVAEINKDIAYTPVGREQAVSQVIAGFTPTAQLYHDKAVGIIDIGLEALEEKWKRSSAGKLTDGGYQAGLANVIKMLELEVVKEQDDILNIINTYAGDFNALAAIREILHQSKNEQLQNYAILIPTDNRSKNKSLLTQLRGNVDKYINIDTVQSASKSWNVFNQGLTGVSMSLDSMSQFVSERLGDMLELLN